MSPTADPPFLAYPSGENDGSIQVFNTLTLQPVCVIQAHRTPVSKLAFNIDGTLLATASDRGTILRVFNVTNGQKLHQLRRGTYPATIHCLSFNMQSNMLCVTSDSDTVHIFKLAASSPSGSHLMSSFLPERVGEALESTRDFAHLKLPTGNVASLCALSSGTAIGMVVSLSLDQVDENKELLEKVAFAIHNQRRIVVVTGAGISVSAGIPDFRSADGLYARILSGSGSKTAKGKDFFDASFFHNSTTRPLFNRFVAELCKLCSSGSPTPTHSFIANLVKEGRVTRWYSQNIDGLEKAMGLQTTSCVDLHSTKKVPVVSLHGTLDRLICSACKTTTEFTDSHKGLFSEGDSPSCPSCELFSKERQASGRRAIKGGILRPDIVLYNEPHPQGDVIAEYVGFDISKRPTVLIVMGTSLKVVGLKKMIKDLARSVRQEPNGLVLFINKTPAPRSEWKTIFDFELIGECDAWVNILTGLPKAAPKKPLAVPITPKKDGRIDQIFKVVRKSTAEKAKSADPGNSENLVDNKVKPITRSASKTTTVL